VLSSDSFAVSNVKLYPNPTSNVLNIESEGTIQNVSIFNILGQEVINKSTNESSIRLDVSGLNEGVYVVKSTIDGKVSSTKFIKE
jgi:endoglucanase